MATLITGGAGFIGSHTAVELLQAGVPIVVADNLSNSSRDVIEKIQTITGAVFPFYQLDLCEPEQTDWIFQNNEIDGVIHFAGLKAVGESVQKPLEYYHNNLVSTLNLCRSMRKYGCKRLVFSSSATVYGIPETVPMTEDAPLGATNPYGYTKLMIEQILSDLAVSDPTWCIVLLRYFNPIGAHESGLIGESPNGIPNNLMPYINQVACKKLAKLHVFGDDYPTPDGTGVRDYIHVVDLSQGHLKALDYTQNHTGAVAVNLGTGHGTSVLELLKTFERVNGVPIPYQIDPRRPGDIAVSYADPSKAEALFGWKAERNVEQMCKDAWHFTCSQH